MHEQDSSLSSHCDLLTHCQRCTQGMFQEEGLKELFLRVFLQGPRAVVMNAADFKPNLVCRWLVRCLKQGHLVYMVQSDSHGNPSAVFYPFFGGSAFFFVQFSSSCAWCHLSCWDYNLCGL